MNCQTAQTPQILHWTTRRLPCSSGTGTEYLDKSKIEVRTSTLFVFKADTDDAIGTTHYGFSPPHTSFYLETK
jgi:hypothetical protein